VDGSDIVKEVLVLIFEEVKVPVAFHRQPEAQARGGAVQVQEVHEIDHQLVLPDDIIQRLRDPGTLLWGRGFLRVKVFDKVLDLGY